MAPFINKAPSINSIDSKFHTDKLKGSRTCLIGYSDFILNSFKGVHTHRHTCIPTSRTKAVSGNQARAWFKNTHYACMYSTALTQNIQYHIYVRSNSVNVRGKILKHSTSNSIQSHNQKIRHTYIRTIHRNGILEQWRTCCTIFQCANVLGSKFSYSELCSV